ncbi:MAG: zinc ABC transporter substrate-binding protein, partial [Oscillospiraceae bacterium]
ILPEETFVKAVCGDKFDVVTLIPPGSSPENFEPSPKDMEMLSKAKIYFSIGVPTEKANILPKLSKDIRLCSLNEAAAKVYPDLLQGEERDPHIWLSPKRVSVIIDKIAEELIELDKENEKIYLDNAKAFKDELSKADLKIKETLAAKKSSVILTFHPAFNYFANEYGLEAVSIEKEGKEATAAGIKEVIDFAKSHGIKIIFCQAEISSAQVKAIAQEIGAEIIMLEPLSPNYIENLNIIADAFANN